MKIRLLFLTLAFALVGSPGLRADEETELGAKMEKIGGAFRFLRRNISDASKKAELLDRVAVLRENAEAALKLEPAMKADIPAAQQAKFVADYQAEMKKFIDMAGKLEASIKADKFDEGAALIDQINKHQKQSHTSFKKDSKKK